MRKVFNSIEVSETVLVRDALLHNGIDALLQNQHSNQSAIPAFRPPAEVWIQNDGDFNRARRVVEIVISRLDNAADAPPWICLKCREENPASFDVCWKCGRTKATSET